MNPIRATIDLIRAARFAIETRSGMPAGAGMSIADFDRVLDMIAGGGSPSYTGKIVTPRTALGIDAVWACVDALAGDFATLPKRPYQWIEPGVSKKEARGHYLWSLLTESANEHMSSWLFYYVMEAYRNLWGNAYAEIEINGRGQVAGLWPWRPDRVKVWREDPDDARSPIWYTYKPLDFRKPPVTVPSYQMLHVRWMSLDGLTGLTPIEVHRQRFSLSMAMEEHAGRFYGNGAALSGVFTHPAKIGPKGIENWKKFLDSYSGVSNSYRTMILEEGMKYERIGIPPADAQYIESENLNDGKIARIYKVPAHRINLLDRATNNNIEQLNMNYVQFTLGVNTANWFAEMGHSLLSPRERDSITLWADYNHLLAADHAGRAAYYVALGNQGALSADDMRHREGLNPLPDGRGAIPRVGYQTTPISSDPPVQQ